MTNTKKKRGKFWFFENFSLSLQPISVAVGKGYLNLTLQPHSFNTLISK